MSRKHDRKLLEFAECAIQTSPNHPKRMLEQKHPMTPAFTGLIDSHTALHKCNRFLTSLIDSLGMKHGSHGSMALENVAFTDGFPMHSEGIS
jgi:hypothetical protein